MTWTEQQTAARRRQAEKEQAARFARAGGLSLAQVCYCCPDTVADWRG